MLEISLLSSMLLYIAEYFRKVISVDVVSVMDREHVDIYF